MPFQVLPNYSPSLVAPTLNSTATSTKKGAHRIPNTLRRNATFTYPLPRSGLAPAFCEQPPTGRAGNRVMMMFVMMKRRSNI